MRIALIRHGLTIGNVYGAYVGATDQPLCREGREELLERKKHAGYPVAGIVFSSPLLRCIQTAKLLYPALTPQELPELRERDFGAFEGLNHSEIITLPGHEHWGSTPDNMEFPGGESWDSFARRSLAGFFHAAEQSKLQEKEMAAIICHGGTIMAVMEHFGDPAGSRYDYQCAAGAGVLLLYDDQTQTAKLSRKIVP